jgi:hypothetical protein
MGPAAAPLPSFEVAVRRRRATFSRREDVGVHAQAHRAAGAAPFEACVEEDARASFKKFVAAAPTLLASTPSIISSEIDATGWGEMGEITV